MAVEMIRDKAYLIIRKTYGDCEFRPGAHLNVLLGPNGTGKSSIVCAICLGLAGAPKLLGRATEVRDFIKHGASQAMVEIELYSSSGRNHIITRDMFRSENRSNWKINGKATTMKEVWLNAVFVKKIDQK
ncbi:hypothetical protein OS493_036831 [Desmophyllum pertusum]|uniref:Structural maintenance of chromosomes protein 5 n=1 Tax=Desmophyllum pertusum TaxID=174260 RepID=A0A9X0D7M4_9CNID|nr:hypothetical protein OS493_036831 [Desmophyllum pertusum]